MATPGSSFTLTPIGYEENVGVGHPPRANDFQMILVSHRWSRSCMIFSRPQQCHRFNVLPDSRNSRYTSEMDVRENPNFITTSEILSPISRAQAITPRSDSLKS
ncbi:uncharacterized protein TNCV_3521381 [Trichonephila clavipes]|nr:uncharacterized protein TNCV_3521381 [Trichonephila clavipes]